VFSDLEDSVDEIVYLPAIPSPDAPDEQPDKCLGSSKFEDSNHSGSPSSMDAVQNGQAIPPASSPMEGKSTHICHFLFQLFLIECNCYIVLTLMFCFPTGG
jgi:hypothetical protein